MTSFENFFNFNKEQKAGILLEDDSDNLKELDSIPYPLLIHKIEKEIVSLREERNGMESDKDYQEKIRSRKKEFLEKITDENKINLSNILFGTEEFILRNEIENKNGKRTKNMIIEDVKLQQEMAYFVTDNENDLNLLEDYWYLYDYLFEVNGNDGVAKGKSLKHGVLAPIALKNILDKKYNNNGEENKRMDILYSTTEDDALKSIDMIAIDNKSKINLLIQVKGDAMSAEKLNKMVKPKNKHDGNNKDEENKELIYVLNEKDFADDDTSMKEKSKKLNKFNSGCASYMKEHGEILREKGFETLGIFIYVPSVVGDQAMININGQPDKKLDSFISEFLDIKIPDLANK